MPLYTYTCPACRRRGELLYRSSDGPLPERLPCETADCDGVAVRDTVYRMRVLGPVFEHLESYNKALLTPAERRAGRELKTAKDIERYERDRGLSRTEAHVARVQDDEARHDAYAIDKVRKEDGHEAALEYIDTTEIMNATGWDKRETEAWKEQAHAAEATAAANPGLLADTNPNWKPATADVAAQS